MHGVPAVCGVLKRTDRRVAVAAAVVGGESVIFAANGFRSSRRDPQSRRHRDFRPPSVRGLSRIVQVTEGTDMSEELVIQTNGPDLRVVLPDFESDWAGVWSAVDFELQEGDRAC